MKKIVIGLIVIALLAWAYHIGDYLVRECIAMSQTPDGVPRWLYHSIRYNETGLAITMIIGICYLIIGIVILGMALLMIYKIQTDYEN